MFFGLDKVLDLIVSNATGGESGKKTRDKTHLSTDSQLTTFNVVIPLVLLLFVRTFTPSTFQSSSINCVQYQYVDQPATARVILDPETKNHYKLVNFTEAVIIKSSNNNRHYMHNYCWENLQHHVLDEDQKAWPISRNGDETIDLSDEELKALYCAQTDAKHIE